MIPEIRNWPAFRAGSDFHAPEIRPLCVRGFIYGHATFPDGKTIVTSRIVGVDGPVIRTENGSRYRLGEPHEKCLAWLAESGIPFDAAEPIRMRRIV